MIVVFRDGGRTVAVERKGAASGNEGDVQRL